MVVSKDMMDIQRLGVCTVLPLTVDCRFFMLLGSTYTMSF